MATTSWFDDLPVVGCMPPEQAAPKLREVGENGVADSLRAAPAQLSPSFATLREGAAAVGYSIFVGLSEGSDGVAFRCFTVNVKNEQDEALIGFLDSDLFRAGLRLASAAQPALAPLSAMALSLTRALAGRNRNVPVQDFYLGLDFGSNPTGARLALGSYLAVQVPESKRAVWDWDEWAYNPSTGQVVQRADKAELLPYNYVVFGVSRCDP